MALSGEMAAPASPKGEGRIHDVVVLRRPPRPCELGLRAEHGGPTGSTEGRGDGGAIEVVDEPDGEL